ncbi:Thiolase, N-terminal domain-containing protein [Dipodascopsis tothii]|uniref:Thiolase, N-terminal domain-containing protein n=1 Tax=Dipodascopsis tothii TaxID=44089 RepID=UPI0034CFF091
MAVNILAAARTPVGKFGGALKSHSAVSLGSVALKAALERSKIPAAADVSEVYMGHVLQGGVGQSPARQAAIGAGLPASTDATTINKVCASGLKAVMLSAQTISAGAADVIAAGGMESMSNVPYYLPRQTRGFGDITASDGIVHDGLWDVYNKIHMGSCAENTARKFGLTREAQDDFAKLSYERARAAQAAGAFAAEMAPVEVKSRKGSATVDADEEPGSADLARLGSLRPAFEKDGTVTAGNASTINDGASAVVLASAAYTAQHGLQPLGRVVAYADAARDPIDFTIAPALAIPRALERAGLTAADVARFEINEAFSAVALANVSLLGLDIDKVNPAGGAVALGHPIGSSGCRILVTLLHGLKPGEFGVAAICNGGGAASAMVVQRT